jgi:hypothetical protein
VGCEEYRRNQKTSASPRVAPGTSAWSTDPACGRLEAQQELGEDTRGTTTSPWHCLGN